MVRIAFNSSPLIVLINRLSNAFLIDCACSRSALQNLWALLALAFPYTLRARPYDAMWPGSRTAVLTAQYLFVISLGFNGLVLFVLIGGLHERELRCAVCPPWPRPSTWFGRHKSTVGAAGADESGAIEMADLRAGRSGASSARSIGEGAATSGRKSTNNKSEHK